MATDLSLRILISDADPAMRRLLRTTLRKRGYRIFEVESIQDTFDAISQHRPDLILLGLGIHNYEGLAVIRRMRRWSTLPILVLSHDHSEVAKVSALDAGADDYITKPVALEELQARIRAAMRHVTLLGDQGVHCFNDLTVDLTRRLVKRESGIVHLTPIEYEILKVMVRYAGRIITHNQLLTEVWGAADDDKAKLLRVHIRNLRSKIEPDPSAPQFIVTAPGVGYTLRQSA